MMDFKERIINYGWRGFEWLLPRGYELRITGEENLEILNSSPNIPAVLYFNHISADDPLVVAYLIGKYLPNRLRNVIFPVSEEYLKAGRKPEYLIGVKITQFAEFSTVPIVQSYRLRDGRLTEAKKNELLQKSQRLSLGLAKRIIRRMKNQPLVVLAPEGHRSSDGRLLPAEEGLGFVAELMRKKGGGLLLPVGLFFDGKYESGFNYRPWPLPRKILNVKVGEPITTEDIIDQAKNILSQYIQDFRGSLTSSHLSHFLMLKLRGLLPENMWGVYHPDLFPKTLAGELRLGIDVDGEVKIIGL